MNIEGVIICRDYADFLHYTLPHTMGFLSEFVVVTSPEDRETQQVCEYHGARMLVTDAFVRYGGPFNKGAAINEGLSVLPLSEWALIMDADILVPAHVRPYLEGAELRQDCIYSVDRRNCDGLENLNRPELCPVMKRISLFGAQPPAGYFQLWHSSFMPHGPWYEEHYGFADRTDMNFAKRFPRREYLETWVLHLDNGGHVGGVNWKGRVSERFVGEDELRLDLGRT